MKKKIIVIFALFLFFSAYGDEVSQGDMQRYSSYYSDGLEYLKDQRYDSAIREFKKVLRFSPYDTMTQASLANTYYAKAQYLRQTTKEVKRALVDYKSAAFYAKYWNNTDNQGLAALSQSAQSEVISLEKRLQSPATPLERLQEAKVLRAQGELAAAAYDFQQLTSTNYSKEAYENLGNIYKNLNNLKYAMDYFKTAIDNDPKNPKLHFLYGVMLDEAKNFEASMEQYNLALQYGEKSPELLEILENKWTQNIVNNPSDAQSRINLGAIYQKQGNLEEAKAQYIKASQMDMTDDTALYNLASLYIQQKNFPSAIGVYDKLLNRNPKNIDAINYKAEAYKALENYDAALKQYEAVLAINPNNNEAKNGLDDIILNHFSGQKLQNYLAQKAVEKPNSYEAQFNYALELHKNKDYKGAINYYRKAQALDQSKEETYLNLAQIFMEQKNFKEANKVAQKGLMVLVKSPQLENVISEIEEYNLQNQYETAAKYYENGKYQDALKQYLDIKNKTRDVKMAIASCYWQMNDFKNSNKYYLELLAENPTDLEVLTNSAYAYFSLNDIENAKATAAKILSLDKGNSEAKKILAEISQKELDDMLQDAIAKYEKGDFNTSLTILNKLLGQKTDSDFALYYKGLCLDELDKKQDAIKQYKALISKNPNFESAYYSLAVDLDGNENYKDAITNYKKFVELKGNAKDEMTTFASNRVKELEDYLNSLKK